MIECKYCGKKDEPIRKTRVYCSKTCSQKDYRKRNLELIKKKQKKWREATKEYRREYMKKYRSTEEYRVMKQKHDKDYREKNGDNKPPRNEEQKFKSQCRRYATLHVKREKCCLCGSVESLELHHSKGYKKRSVHGVIVVCTKCHRQVIHGRGTRIDGTKIKNNLR